MIRTYNRDHISSMYHSTTASARHDLQGACLHLKPACNDS